jgi:hypothetical protein
MDFRGEDLIGFVTRQCKWSMQVTAFRSLSSADNFYTCDSQFGGGQGLNLGWESVFWCLVFKAGQLASTFHMKAPVIAVGEFQGLALRNAMTIIHA